MMGPDFKVPRSEVEKQWAVRKAVSGKPYGTPEIFWWKSFDDPTLTHLVELAYENNLSLQMAGMKIIQERALLSHGIGELFPQHQGVMGGYNFTYLPGLSNISTDNLGSLSGSAFGPIINQILQRLGMSSSSIPSVSASPYNVFNSYTFYSSWELDFWGKYRRKIEADKDSYLASVASYDDSLVTVIGDVASNYVNMRTYEEEVKITLENVKVQQESLRIATARFKGGQVSQLDVTQAQTELAKTEAGIPTLQNNIQQCKDALAVLIGKTPSDIDPLLKPGKIPVVPPDLTAGIPRDLVRRRPDVRSAALQAAAKSAYIGINIAVMLPAFSIKGFFGSGSSNVGTQQLTSLLNWQNSFVNASTGVSQPLFNYGQLINNVRTSVAEAQAAIVNYQNVVLTAQQEVENGLSGYYYGKKNLFFLGEAVKAAKQSTKLAMVRYMEGQTDYTTVLTAEQQQLLVENSYAGSQGATICGVIAAYRSLGGGWQIRNGHDVISEDEKKQMTERTMWAWWGPFFKPDKHLPKVSPEDMPADYVPKNRPIWNLESVNK